MHYHCMVHISFNSPCFTTSVYIPGFLPHTKNDPMSIRTIERMTAGPIAMTHVQSSHHCIKRAIMSHYPTTLAIIIQYSHIDRDISQNLLRLGCVTIALVRASFVQILFFFYMWLFWQKFTTHFWSNKKFSRFCSSCHQLRKWLYLLRPFAVSDIFRHLFWERGQ